MFRFALTRIAMALPTLLIVSVSVFVLIRLIPGDPAQLLLGDLATPASLAELRGRLGLDRSVPVQFGIWLGLLLLLLFGVKLGWLPVVGYVDIAEDWKSGLLYLVLPVLTLFLHEIGV